MALVAIVSGALSVEIGTLKAEPFLAPAGRHPLLLMTTQLQPGSSYRTIVATPLLVMARVVGSLMAVWLELFLRAIPMSHLLLVGALVVLLVPGRVPWTSMARLHYPFPALRSVSRKLRLIVVMGTLQLQILLEALLEQAMALAAGSS